MLERNSQYQFQHVYLVKRTLKKCKNRKYRTHKIALISPQVKHFILEF